jgi:hypothetical protein
MRKLYLAAVIYLIAGLGAGLFYREFTKANAFPEGSLTQLGLVHTHLLALGMLVMLIVMALEKTMRLSDDRRFVWFFWFYNAGVALTAAMMIWHGVLTVLGQASSPAISGIAGLGHIAVTVGLVLFFLVLGRAVRRDQQVAA